VKSFVFVLLAMVVFSACSKSDNHQEVAHEANCMPGIVGGEKLGKDDSFTTKVVLIWSKNSTGQEGTCTATPIAQDTLLTAAHCVREARRVRAFFYPEITCSSGFDKRTNMMSAVSYKIHENYIRSTSLTPGENDIALIKLSGNIPANYEVSAIYDGKSRFDSDELIIPGYGDTSEKDDGLPTLRKVVKSLKKSVMDIQGDQHLILEQSHGGVCHGDSGGPNFIRSQGTYQIFAINSVVQGNNQETSCHGLSKTMYAPYFKDWIYKTMEDLRSGQTGASLSQ
jgi:secreted trypsin-like serine protease